MLAPLLSRLECWVFEPPDSLVGKPLWLLSRILRYPYALVRDMLRGELTLRAMSLVYTTLLSVVPLIALSFSVLKGLDYHHELEPMLFSFLEPIGEKGAELTAQIMTFVDNVRGEVLGSIGLVILLYTVFSMILKVEESFNFVWRVERPRSFGRRVSEYLSVLVVGPALLVTALGLLATIDTSFGGTALSHYAAVDTVLHVLRRIGPYVMVTVVFTFLYAFMPNTKVQLRAAAIAGIAAGVAWAASGAIFTSFVAGSSTRTLIYAGFAIVILALIWVYVSWLVLLLGAQLAFYIQYPQYLRPGRGEIHLNASLRERTALSIVYLIVHDYCCNQNRWSANSLAEHLGLPGAAIGGILAALERKNLLLLTDEETWVPARDPEAISLLDVYEAVRKAEIGPRLGRIRDIAPAVDAARRAELALHESLKGRSIKDLIERKQSEPQQVASNR
jgi:membrane protein